MELPTLDNNPTSEQVPCTSCQGASPMDPGPHELDHDILIVFDANDDLLSKVVMINKHDNSELSESDQHAVMEKVKANLLQNGQNNQNSTSDGVFSPTRNAAQVSITRRPKKTPEQIKEENRVQALENRQKQKKLMAYLERKVESLKASSRSSKRKTVALTKHAKNKKECVEFGNQRLGSFN